MPRARRILLACVALCLLVAGAGPVASQSTTTGELAPRLAIVASAGDFPDALAAGGLAGTAGAPVLLSGTAALDPAAAEALTTFAPDLVVVVGGPVALSDQVVADIGALGLTVRRVAGAGRTQTAAAVAEFAAELGLGRPVVTGLPVSPTTIPGLDAETLQGNSPEDLGTGQVAPGDLQTVSSQNSVTNAITNTHSVTCPAGTVVVGGGAFSSVPNVWVIEDSRPRGEDRWEVRYTKHDGVAGNQTSTVFARCLAVGE